MADTNRADLANLFAYLAMGPTRGRATPPPPHTTQRKPKPAPAPHRDSGFFEDASASSLCVQEKIQAGTHPEEHTRTNTEEEGQGERVVEGERDSELPHPRAVVGQAAAFPFTFATPPRRAELRAWTRGVQAVLEDSRARFRPLPEETRPRKWLMQSARKRRLAAGDVGREKGGEEGGGEEGGDVVEGTGCAVVGYVGVRKRRCVVPRARRSVLDVRAVTHTPPPAPEAKDEKRGEEEGFAREMESDDGADTGEGDGLRTGDSERSFDESFLEYLEGAPGVWCA
ncbi:hypothetical protein GLOTRDRAFT_138381 [Gloeophyllum trabeum ATCC 11539]|uniref:Uncharacterized protein n=1 Tax=Gloeophyllum trabeum (strain ATCC 11539 / FP-39264 / Madison 617) TaxID=670483 RepID=S7RQ61_GLOTA|nr:uncharacterized protein GLOTRDRAFT_138381 [Gloeophyllum trabeum ATCC 11539]EPQ56730.1 hypothetical protein GLOTRDRAFT_138381 [Gloeophyllum trabeum ATCC 11539]